MLVQEFEESGDPEKHFQALLSLAKEGIQKGKVWLYSSSKKAIKHILILTRYFGPT